MKKYKKHYMSKYDYPTRLIENALIIGHKVAARDLEKRLKRPLASDVKITTRGGNWCFAEPIKQKAENVS